MAHQVFHTRLLPHVLLPNTSIGLSDAFHDYALEICERMGGLDGLLAVQNDATSEPDRITAQSSLASIP